MEKFKIRVQTAPWINGYEVWVLKDTIEAGVGEKKFFLEKESSSESCNWFEYTPTTYNIAPTLELTKKNAQVLMDDLWKVGIRPTDAGDSAGALTATKQHLEDMRKIVFDYFRESFSPKINISNEEIFRRGGKLNEDD